MRAFVVSCVFPPEPVVSSQTSADVASCLAARGHEVTVFTSFASRPGRQLYPNQTRSLYRRQVDDRGFRIVRCFSTYSVRSTILSRFSENIVFGLTSSAAVLRAPRPDVIYSNTWPIFATGLLWLVARLRRSRMVLSVQDVYPESLQSQGRLRPSNLLVRAMKAVDGSIARGCEAVIVISDRFATLYREDRGVAHERLFTIPNWIDPARIRNDGRSGDLRHDKGIPEDAFLVVYAGNVGAAADVENVVEAFRHLSIDTSIHLLIAGDGTSMKACQALAGAVGTNRIHFHHPFPIEDTARVLSAGQLLILPSWRRQSETSVPSKLIAYMLAGRPVLAMAVPQSDLAHTVERAGCGLTIEPGDPRRTACAIRDMAASSEEARSRMGAAGRDFATRHLTPDVCLPQVIDIVERAGGKLGNAGEAQLRPMREDDVRAVVRIHLDAFPGFFLSFLGPRFLRLLYRSILEDPTGIALVCADARRVYGLVAGTTHPVSFYGRLLKRRWWRFGLASLPALMRRPFVARRLLSALWMPQQSDRGAGGGWLMSIAVAPAAQCGGLGSSLVNGFLRAAEARGAHRVYLTTDAVDYAAANRFYQRLGFRLSRSFNTPQGRAMNEYHIALGSPSRVDGTGAAAVSSTWSERAS